MWTAGGSFLIFLSSLSLHDALKSTDCFQLSSFYTQMNPKPKGYYHSHFTDGEIELREMK